MQVEIVNRLDAEQLSKVMALVEDATQLDGVAPLSEQVLLTLGDDLPAGTNPPTSAPHFLAYDGTLPAGYAHLERGSGADAAGAATATAGVDPSRTTPGGGAP